jgi:hypothetical protein
MWTKFRSEPLVLTPDQGTFTGRVDAQGRMVFTRDFDPASYVIQGQPSSQEVFLGNGVLAQGNGTEKVLGAQVAAMLNRHVLETPGAWRDAAGYYRRNPCNRYAWFWHEHGLEHRAYGFAYDDVNDQSSSLATPLRCRSSSPIAGTDHHSARACSRRWRWAGTASQAWAKTGPRTWPASTSEGWCTPPMTRS